MAILLQWRNPRNSFNKKIKLLLEYFTTLDLGVDDTKLDNILEQGNPLLCTELLFSTTPLANIVCLFQRAPPPSLCPFIEIAVMSNCLLYASFTV